MKTFVVNMLSSKDRLKKMDQQLNKLGIKYDVFSAVVGKDLTKKEIDKLYDSKKAVETQGEDLTLGEIGCALSHMFIYKKIINEKIPIALVLEDDGILNDKLKDIYLKLDKKNCKELKKGYEYITLNYSLVDWNKFCGYTKFITKKLIKEKKWFLIPIYYAGSTLIYLTDRILNFLGNAFGPFIIKKYKPLYMTGGYFITYEGAKKLLNLHDKVFIQADLLVQNYYKKLKLKFGMVFPLIINQDATFGTTIDGRDYSDNFVVK